MKKLIPIIFALMTVICSHAQSAITIERADGTKIHTSLENFVEATFTDETETVISASPEAPTFEGLELEAQDTEGCVYIELEQIASHIWATSCRLKGNGNWWDCCVKIVSSDHRSYWGQPFSDECTDSGTITLVEKEATGRYMPAGTYGFIYNDIDNSLRFARLLDKDDITEIIVEKEVLPKSNFTVTYNIGDQNFSGIYLGDGLWKANVQAESGKTFSITRTGKDGSSTKWGAASANETAGATGSFTENQGNAFTLSGIEPGQYTVLFDENQSSFAFMKKNTLSSVRTLTFEDADFKGTANVFQTEKPWSGLIDTPQYGGPMLYGDQASSYQWYDQGNTELKWDGFSKDSYVQAYFAGGYAISNYVSEPGSDYTIQLSIPFGDGSNNFCMAFNREDSKTSKSVDPIYFADGKARVIKSIDVTNCSYTAGSLIYGDAFASAAKEGTEFFVNIRGTQEDGSTVTVKHHLCKNTDVLKDHWDTVDCTSMGKVKQIEIFVTGSDDLGGDYGLNTPGYVAFDNIVVEFDN